MTDAVQTGTLPTGNCRQPNVGVPFRSLAITVNDYAGCDRDHRTCLPE
jgi:hypothetical protein